MSIIFGLICAICSILILIDAFQKSLLKGLFCLICCFYFFWYALFEFEHENKFLIVLGSFIGGGVGGAWAFLHR